ncbi:unnamed protein product [Moneuplotes crassus]|uniref:Uncharacterized protein n=1 Tax=Euplotes crassus TaxID=5936 RepID=A0AAD1U756_EUPCR|nr:unnamed protein product [Moneuplotes crassus]
MENIQDQEDLNSQKCLKESLPMAKEIIEAVLDTIQEHYDEIELRKKVPIFAADLLVSQLNQSMMSGVVPLCDNRADDLLADQVFPVESDSTLVYEYIQDDEPLQPPTDYCCKERVKVNFVYKYKNDSKVKKKLSISKKSKSSLSKRYIMRATTKLFSETSETSYQNSPKKKKLPTFEEQYGDIIKPLADVTPSSKGPKITYDDGLTPETMERLRQESNKRIKAKKMKEQDMREMLQARSHSYNKNIEKDIDYKDGKTPDFEEQLTHAFQIKYKRADSLGVRNLIIDKDQLIRASRPNMDRLIKVQNMKHEIRDPGQELFPEETSITGQDEGAINGENKTQGFFNQHDKGEDLYQQMVDESEETKIKPALKPIKTLNRKSTIKVSKDNSLITSNPSSGIKFSKNFTGRQDISNAFSSLRRNFLPTFGVTYSEKQKEAKMNQQQSSLKLAPSSLKRLSNNIASTSDMSVQVKGEDYISSLPQNRMRRKDYEANNLSFDNIRPLYNMSSAQKFDNRSMNHSEATFGHRESRVDTLKREVSHSLLVNKPLHEEFRDEYDGQRDKSNVYLPKLKTKYTLHITDMGPRVVNKKLVDNTTSQKSETVSNIDDEVEDSLLKTEKDYPQPDYFPVASNPKFSLKKWKRKKRGNFDASKSIDYSIFQKKRQYLDLYMNSNE